jgi:hypothetical protein
MATSLRIIVSYFAVNHFAAVVQFGDEICSRHARLVVEVKAFDPLARGHERFAASDEAWGRAHSAEVPLKPVCRHYWL